MAYARKTRDVAVATVTCGPGVTQLMTALPAAVRARLPMVIFAGEPPLKSAWYNQAIDQGPMVNMTGARYRTLHHIERMPQAIRDAFVEARQDNIPIVLGIPFDLQNREWTGDDSLPEPSHDVMPDVSPIPPHPADLERAVELVDRSKRVVVMAGMGAVNANAAAACRALAERTGGLLATSLPARGLFHDDPYCIGICGSFSTEAGLTYLREADLVIFIGCSLALYAGGGGQLSPNAQLLQIDIEPASVAQGQRVARNHLRADAKLGTEALTSALPVRSESEPGWRSDEIASHIRNSKPDSKHYPAEPGLHDPRNVVAALETALPLDWEMVNSSGHCSGFFAHMPSRPQDKFLTIREFGAIGNGTSYAMGVAAARPHQPVVLFDGDGSLLMHAQELETMQRHRMNILVVVMNDGAYGSEIHKLRSEGLPDDGGVFGRPDFAAIAKGFHVSDKVITPIVRRNHPQQTT